MSAEIKEKRPPLEAGREKSMIDVVWWRGLCVTTPFSLIHEHHITYMHDRRDLYLHVYHVIFDGRCVRPSFSSFGFNTVTQVCV